MVNKNKNTVINNNNKNIIQICYEKPKKKQKREKSSSGGGSGSGEPKKYLKDNAMESQPINLVNSFPNSTGLEDRRARFIDAMRDPFSTKSPYSIFDNGSNTFAREGNTVGAEVPVQPQINQDTYFEQPRTVIRPPQRIPASSVGNFSARSPINGFDDGLDDEMSYEDLDDERSQASSNYQNAWNRQQDYDDEEEAVYASPNFGVAPVQEDEFKSSAAEETRFSNSPRMPPVNMPIQPYRRDDIPPTEDDFEDTDVFIAPTPEERQKERDEFKELESEMLTEERRKRMEQQEAYNKLADELLRKKDIQFRYKTIV